MIVARGMGRGAVGAIVAAGLCLSLAIAPPQPEYPGGGGGGGWPGYPRPQQVIPELVPLPLELAYEIRITRRDARGNILTFTITPILV